MDNPNCDGSGPHNSGEVRVLPTGGGGNAILCQACFTRELAWRRARNRDLAKQNAFDLPSWDSLRIYSAEPVPQRFRVYHDDELQSEHDTYNAAWLAIHNASHGGSVAWQVKHEGWQITQVLDNDIEVVLRAE